jgi:hypothetical protein
MTYTEHTKPAAAHTPEPWSVDTADCFLITADADGGMVAATETLDRDDAACSSNARRIVAAVNACRGLSTKALEQGVVRELLEALEAQDMAEWDAEASRRKGYFDRARELRRAAIAKARSA